MILSRSTRSDPSSDCLFSFSIDCAHMETASLLSQGMLQMLRFGPFVNARVSYKSVLALPQGLVAAGAACTATTVDADDAIGQAKITAILVRLGFVNFVRDIVVRLCEVEDRADAVGAVTAALLQLQELVIVTQINNALVASGNMVTGAKIAASMVAQGYTELSDIATQQVGEGSILGAIQNKGQEILAAVSPAPKENLSQPAETVHSSEPTEAQEPNILGSIAQSARQIVGMDAPVGQEGKEVYQQVPERAI